MAKKCGPNGHTEENLDQVAAVTEVIRCHTASLANDVGLNECEKRTVNAFVVSISQK